MSGEQPDHDQDQSQKRDQSDRKMDEKKNHCWICGGLVLFWELSFVASFDTS